MALFTRAPNDVGVYSGRGSATLAMDFSRSGPEWIDESSDCIGGCNRTRNHWTAASHGRFDGGGEQALQVSTTETIPGDAEEEWMGGFCS